MQKFIDKIMEAKSEIVDQINGLINNVQNVVEDAVKPMLS